ncbi:MAG: ArsR/SmtB family transcription factor [Nocardioidaceae bacterium]
MVDAVWSALAHPARRQIVDRLRSGPALTGELATLLAGSDDTSRFATQRHLKVLREAGVVLVDELGPERRNFLNSAALYQATIGWLEPRSRQVAHGLDALRREAERGHDSPGEPTPRRRRAPCPSSSSSASSNRSTSTRHGGVCTTPSPATSARGGGRRTC